MNNKITDTTKKIIEHESQVQGSEIHYRLKQARLKALDKCMDTSVNTTKSLQNIFFRAWFIPATAAAALAFYFMMPILTIVPIENSNQATETEIYVDVTDMELIEQLELVENLEFYEWLSQEENLSSI
ncbi:MAG: hypothetical protein L3J83_02815 [Proteobacteria bacterium]|nr:hypothetical protein [Pseudomonadota bacterium]